MKISKKIRPLPFNVYYSAVVCLVIVGLLASAYLFYSHYRVYTDIAYESFCAISKSINCDTVSESAYSVIFDVPVPLWGILGYTMLLLCVVSAGFNQPRGVRTWAVIFWLAVGFSGVSVALVMVSTYLIGSYCILCIVTYAVNLLVAWFAWLIRRRFSDSVLIRDSIQDIQYILSRKRVALPALASLLAIGIACVLFFPRYWLPAPIQSMGDQKLSSGTTPEGFPWIGSRTSGLEIVMFSDYQCFQCRKVHHYLRQLISKSPDKVRLIQRHFPMDHEVNPSVKEPMHIGSGQLAMLAIQAAGKGKFWEINELLYGLGGESRKIDLRWLAEQTGMETADLVQASKNPGVTEKLKRDIREGLRLGIQGTPSFVIDGQLYSGNIPLDILKMAFE